MAEARLRRVRADNPSALTGSGTNTWIVGEGAVTVIDPGPALPAHLTAILAALDAKERVARIVVTHAHRDHSALARPLAEATGAEVLAFGTAEAGRSAVMSRLVEAGFEGGGEGADGDFAPDARLADGDRLDLPGHHLALEAIHTPGHMGGHLCLALGEVLFSGDHVMGWATSLVSPPDGDMGAYMASLNRLAARDWSRLLPGHGEAVEDPATRIADLIAHRRQREAQVLSALAAAPGSASDLARRIYTDVSPTLLPAASRNVLSHLIDLADRNLATCEGLPSLSTPFRGI